MNPRTVQAVVAAFAVLFSSACSKGGHVATNLAFHRVTEEGVAGAIVTELGGATLHLDPVPVLDDPVVASAEVLDDGDGWSIRVQFGEPTTTEFAKVTKELVGERLAILVDGQTAMAPVIRSMIGGGSVMISGDFSEAEATALVAAILGERD